MTDNSSSQPDSVTANSTSPPAVPAEPPRDKAIPHWLWAGALVVIVLALLLVFARG